MCQSSDIGEIAKATGKGIDAGRALGRFLERFVSGPLEQVSLMAEDKLRYRRVEKLVDLRERLDQRLRERGLLEPTRRLPIKVVIPLLDAALIEDDAGLQELWVNLLANSADADSGVEMRRTFVEILSNFTTLDAIIFDKIYSIPDSRRNEEIWTLYLPEKAVLEQPSGEVFSQLPDVELSLANLMRNSCLNTAVSWGGTQNTGVVTQTILGRHLYQAISRTRRGTEPIDSA